MMTIKLFDEKGFRSKIVEAESFTILRNNKGGTHSPDYAWAEITCHSDHGGVRYDVGHREPLVLAAGCEGPQLFTTAFIENRYGKTVERLDYSDFVREKVG